MRRVDHVLLAVLTGDGFIVGLLSIAFLNVHVGVVPVPVTALLGGLANAVLLWLAAGHTGSSARMLPLAGWVIAMGVGLFGGPGGDALLFTDWRTLLLVLLGAGIPAVVSWSGRLPVGSDPSRRGIRGRE